MDQAYWDKAVAFHGHACPGLAVGVRVCEAAVEKMGISPAGDEELVCITENDACGVDAVQALLCCTIGKGNLIYKNTGKQAFTFISRQSGKAMRFYLKVDKREQEREEWQEYLLQAPVDEVFNYREVEVDLPEPARKFASVACEVCGETAAEHKIRLQEERRVCLSCFKAYDRGW